MNKYEYAEGVDRNRDKAKRCMFLWLDTPKSGRRVSYIPSQRFQIIINLSSYKANGFGVSGYRESLTIVIQKSEELKARHRPIET